MLAVGLLEWSTSLLLGVGTDFLSSSVLQSTFEERKSAGGGKILSRHIDEALQKDENTADSNYDYDGGGFVPTCKDFGRMFDSSSPTSAFFFFFTG